MHVDKGTVDQTTELKDSRAEANSSSQASAHHRDSQAEPARGPAMGADTKALRNQSLATKISRWASGTPSTLVLNQPWKERLRAVLWFMAAAGFLLPVAGSLLLLVPVAGWRSGSYILGNVGTLLQSGLLSTLLFVLVLLGLILNLPLLARIPVPHPRPRPKMHRSPHA